MSIYKDPENKEVLLERMSTLESLEDVRKMTIDVFPTWIIGFVDNFSTDYPHIQRNWVNMCTKFGIKRQKIMIIDDMVFDKDHSFIIAVAECFTRAGFMVRRKIEYIPCRVCGNALPSQLSWKLLRDNLGNNIPSNWSDKCSTCN
jgi:hypothetical protein